MLVVIVVMVGIVVTIMIVVVDSDGGGCDVTLLDGSGIQILMAEDNYDELASPVTSVKNDSTAKDNTDELVNPVTNVKNDSMAEDNINELVSPVTSMKNDSSGSKPDKISTIKPRSMNNGNKVLPCYRNSSSTLSYNAGNTRRELPPVLAMTSVNMTKNIPLKKSHGILYQKERTNFLLMSIVLLGPWWEMQKRVLVKQKPSNPPESVLGEKKKVTKIEQKIVHFANRGCKPELEEKRNVI
ncbi:hypothetical protein FXO37_04015 [Capsicum annuum]|nr:hypothetical protein FXO37_04015 [Capsicum annuum]